MRHILIVVCCVVALTGTSFAQTPAQPSASATVIAKSEIESPLARNPRPSVIDQQVRLVNINGEYNVAVATVARTPGTGSQIAGSLRHGEVTEIYHIISGSGTFVSGGTMENAKPAPADASVVTLTGPSTTGGAIRNGASRGVGPGDVLIVPPNVPHWFSEITSDLVYLIIRVDPHKVLQHTEESKR